MHRLVGLGIVFALAACARGASPSPEATAPARDAPVPAPAPGTGGALPLPGTDLTAAYPDGLTGPPLVIAADGAIRSRGEEVARVRDSAIHDGRGVIVEVRPDGTVTGRSIDAGTHFEGDVLVLGNNARIALTAAGTIEMTGATGTVELLRVPGGRRAPRLVVLVAMLASQAQPAGRAPHDEPAEATAEAPPPAPHNDDEDGGGGGVVTDGVGGVVGGVVGVASDGIGLPPPPPPPPPPPGRLSVAPRALEAGRIAGDRDLVPDEAVVGAIRDAGKAKVTVSLRVCPDATGVVTRSTPLRFSGVPAFDAAAQRLVLTWRFRPYLVHGKPTAVCTAVAFRYKLAPAATAPTP